MCIAACLDSDGSEASGPLTNGRVPKGACITHICDPLSENPALRSNIEFELEVILSVQVVSQLNSDYYTNVSQGACTVSC